MATEKLIGEQVIIFIIRFGGESGAAGRGWIYNETSTNFFASSIARVVEGKQYRPESISRVHQRCIAFTNRYDVAICHNKSTLYL